MLIRIAAVENGFARVAQGASGADASDVASDLDPQIYAAAANAFADQLTAGVTGTALYTWLFGAPEALTVLAGGAEGESIYLYFDRTAADAADLNRIDALAALPWELLCSNSGAYLARGGGVFRVRTPVVCPKPRAACAWPLRFVAVSGAAPDGDDDSLALKNELHALHALMVPWGRSINLEVIEQASNEALSRAITADCPSVLHFCGHATSISGLPPSLQTAGQGRAVDTFSINEIGNLGAPPIELVVLNACRSTLAAGPSAMRLWQQSLAEAFLSNGAGAVVAMQADIRGTVAQPFAAAFHAGCLAGHSLEDALTAARAALPPGDPSWAIPVLTLAWLPGAAGARLFDPARRVRQPIEFLGDGPHSYRFTANFHAQRRMLANWVVDQSRHAAPKGPLALLVGGAGTGKSHLLKWSLSSIAHLGFQLRHVDFASFAGAGRSLIELLRAVRDGTPSCPAALRKPLLPQSAFDQFNAALNTYLDPAPAPAATPPAGPIADLLHLPLGDAASLVGGAPFVEHAAELFHQALRQASLTQPVFVALDIGAHGDRFDETELRPFLDKVLIPELAAWQASPSTDPRIRFALCCRREELGGLLARLDRWGQFDADVPYQAPLIEFPALPRGTDIARYATEMYWFRKKDKVAGIVELFAPNPDTVEIGFCRQLTDFLATPNALVAPLWQAITDLRDGVGFMQ